IDNLAISGEHAVIVSNGDEVYIQDLDSTNGTVVNKKAIKKQLLKHGDIIGLGKYQLKFVMDPTTKKLEANGFADTVMMATAQHAEGNTQDLVGASRIVKEDHQQEDVSMADRVSNNKAETEAEETSVSTQEPRLKILSGDKSGETLYLDKTMVKLGKAGKQVAVVTKRQNGYFLTHIAGGQYPIVNGKAIGTHAHSLSNHEEIEVLGIKMEFCLD
ncbi:MAG TPA: FHA domain-containing protein, partial [Methylophilaceae bacterium]|nr:FHA domain-containing protein [Methylophilaceae bacterium]